MSIRSRTAEIGFAAQCWSPDDRFIRAAGLWRRPPTGRSCSSRSTAHRSSRSRPGRGVQGHVPDATPRALSPSRDPSSPDPKEYIHAPTLSRIRSCSCAIVGLRLPSAAASSAAAGGGRQDIAVVVRQVTARFHDVDAAKAAGYELGYVNGAGNRIITGCIAHPTAGVMGYHYFNKQLIDDLGSTSRSPRASSTRRDPRAAQARRGRVRRAGRRLEPARRLGAADDLRTADAHPRPGRGLLHPARLGLEPQPGRMFVDWNPELSCP